MAYVKKYKHDLFISYAHLDNMTAAKHGWIEGFYKHLLPLLAQRIGRLDELDVWWDEKKLSGGTLFGPSIDDGIRQAAVMVSLLSPAYMKSDYCRHELDLFYTKAQEEKPGLKVNNESRLLHALLYNIPYPEWPQELRNTTTGFPFFKEAERGMGYPLEINASRFKKQLLQLVESIYELLESLNKSTDGANEGLDATAASPFRIYFSDVAGSLLMARSRIIKELEKKGYEIICNVPPPFEKDEHEKTVLDKLEQSNLIIHLLNESPGNEFEEEKGVWYPQKQVELGLQTDKPQLIWMPAETNIEVIKEDGYKSFLQTMQNQQQAAKKIEFIRGAKSELTQQILEWAEQIRHPSPPVNGEPAVLLDMHYCDAAYVRDVGKNLSDNGVQTFINPADDDPQKNADTWEDRMGKVRTMVFFYGQVNRDWILTRMSLASQMVATKNYGIKDFFIYMVPPHKDLTGFSLKQRLVNINVVNNSDSSQIDASALRVILNSAKSVA